MGTDIIEKTGVTPGPLVGEILRKLWDEVLDDPGEEQPGVSFVTSEKNDDCSITLAKAFSKYHR